MLRVRHHGSQSSCSSYPLCPLILTSVCDSISQKFVFLYIMTASVAPSESSYDDQSDAGSSAGFYDRLSPRVSEYRLPGEPFPPPLNTPIVSSELNHLRKEVQSWRQSTADAYCAPPSPTMSTKSFASTSTVRDFSDHHARKGHWLVGIQENEEIS